MKPRELKIAADPHDMHHRSDLGVPEEPWGAAAEGFLEDLEEDERERFYKATSTNLFPSVDAAHHSIHDDEIRWQAASRRLNTFLSGIEDFAKAIGLFEHAISTIISPIWGSVRVVLHIAQAFEKYFDRVVEMFTRIGEVMPRFRTYQPLFANHQRFRQVICAMYLDIVLFCVDAKHTFIRARNSSIRIIGFKVIWKPFQQRFNDSLSRFRTHTRSVEKEAGACYIIEERMALDNERRRRETQVEKEKDARCARALARLSPIDYESQHDQIQTARANGTGLWIFNDPSFQVWLSGNESGCFAITGDVGCGKTVLASTIIETLIPKETEGKSAVCYHYCDYADASTLELAFVLGTLTRQLLEKLAPFHEFVQEIEDCFLRRDTLPPWEDVMMLFQKAKRPFAKVTIVLDGIDELPVDSQGAMSCIIAQLAATDDQVMKLIVCSRENSFSAAENGNLHMAITSANTKQDISRYIKETIEFKVAERTLVIHDKSSQRDVERKLNECANNGFLWVKLQIEQLCENLTEEEALQSLQHLPQDLNATYSQIMSKLFNSRNGTWRMSTLRKLLPWMLCARRPLKLVELLEAYAIEISNNYSDARRIPNDAENLLQAFGSLACYNKHTKTVMFVHRSAKDFFLDGSFRICELADGASIPWEINISQAENEVGELCTMYLLLPDFQMDANENPNNSNSETTEQTPWRRNMVVKTLYNVIFSVTGTRTTVSSGNEIEMEKKMYLKSMAPPPAALQERYALLEYTASNWAVHASKLDFQSQVWSDFRTLVFERKLVFDFKPWQNSHQATAAQKGDIKSKSEHLPLIQWAVANEGGAFLDLLKEMAPAELDMYCSVHLAAPLPFDLAIDRRTVSNLKQLMTRKSKHPVVSAWATGRYSVLERLLLPHGFRATLPLSVASLLVLCNEESPKPFLVSLFYQKFSKEYGKKHFEFPIRYAAMTNEVNILRRLLIICNGQEPSQAPLFLDTIFNDWVISLDKLSPPSSLDCMTCFGEFLNKSTLPAADSILSLVRNGCHELLSILLEFACFTKNPDSLTLLSDAVFFSIKDGNVDMVEILLRNYKDIRTLQQKGCHPLQMASLHGKEDIVKLLLNKGAEIDAIGGIYGNALQAACVAGNYNIVALLLKQGANANIRGGEYGTALHGALAHGHQELLQLLLSYGANIDLPNKNNEAALYTASTEGNDESVRLLLSKEVNVNRKGGRNGTALQSASANGHYGIVEQLIQAKADVNAAGGFYGHALRAAASEGHEDIVKLLLANKADINGECGHFGSALFSATLKRNIKVVEILISQGANVNAPNERYGSPLHAASMNGDDQIVRLLLSHGANIDALDGLYGNALQISALHGHMRIVELLLKNGANVNLLCGVYGDSLQAAAANGHVLIVQLLLSNGVDINRKGGVWESSIRAAKARGHTHVVEFLASQGGK